MSRRWRYKLVDISSQILMRENLCFIHRFPFKNVFGLIKVE